MKDPLISAKRCSWRFGLQALKAKNLHEANNNWYSGSILTCYFRQLGDVFKKAGIVVDSENRREIDKIIQHIVGMEGKHCPEIWTEVKKRIKENNSEFAKELKFAWENRN